MRPAHAAGTLTTLILGLTLLPAAPASAGDTATNTRGAKVATKGEGKAMRFVTNLQYDKSGENQEGSDIEFMRLGDRKFALAGTLRKGLQIINITNPREPRRVGVFDCKISQGDIQVWTRGDRVLASYTADGTVGEEGATSQCGTDLNLEPEDAGTVIVDLTRPARPKSVSFIDVDLGSHNMTVHPSGKYLYNSNSDLLTSTQPSIDIFDVSNPARPRKVKDYSIPFVPTSLGSESHDITFNASGTRAYSAALSQTLILNTSDPANPKQVSQTIDPAVNVAHQADPVTLRRKNGTKRTLMIVTDERAGAAASAECPGGGLHVYDITGAKEKSPEKLGTWFIPAATVQDGATCTSHVLRIYPKQRMATIAWYAQGVRVLDISGLRSFQGNAGSVGYGEGVGIKEVGNYVLPDADTWSFKTDRINRDGSFYGYGNDLVRGFDVYRYNGKTVGNRAPLRPADLERSLTSTSTSTTSTAGLTASAAIVLPSLLLAGVVRRRARRRQEGQES
jgi:hypothetical protein